MGRGGGRGDGGRPHGGSCSYGERARRHWASGRRHDAAFSGSETRKRDREVPRHEDPSADSSAIVFVHAKIARANLHVSAGKEALAIKESRSTDQGRSQTRSMLWSLKIDLTEERHSLLRIVETKSTILEDESDRANPSMRSR
ncbi:hypothetical protein HN011_003901 [Eciton burchellii]|nr:hypothetical protein HN011_003901 [Eciton burchellii]